MRTKNFFVAACAAGVVLGLGVYCGQASISQAGGSSPAAACFWNAGNKNQVFKGSKYVRWDIKSDTLDKGYPKPISRGWRGLPDNLDAAIFSGKSASGRNNKVYFFKGSKYWRWDVDSDTLDDGYPQPISAGWRGLPNNLDAALYGGRSASDRDNKLYFFKGDRYWRWDIVKDELDKGYPKKIGDRWGSAPDNIDAAMYGGSSGGKRDNKLYLFKGDKYWRFNINTIEMDDGYPRKTSAGWPRMVD